MIIGLNSKTQNQKYIGRTMTPLISSAVKPLSFDDKQTKQNLAYGCLIMDRFRAMKEVQDKYHAEWCGPENAEKLLSPTAVKDGYRGDYVCPICQAEVMKNAAENPINDADPVLSNETDHSYVVPEGTDANAPDSAPELH